MRVRAQGEELSRRSATPRHRGPESASARKGDGGWRAGSNGGIEQDRALASEAEGACYGTDSISGKTPIFPPYSPAERV